MFGIDIPIIIGVLAPMLTGVVRKKVKTKTGRWISSWVIAGALGLGWTIYQGEPVSLTTLPTFIAAAWGYSQVAYKALKTPMAAIKTRLVG